MYHKSSNVHKLETEILDYLVLHNKMFLVCYFQQFQSYMMPKPITQLVCSLIYSFVYVQRKSYYDIARFVRPYVNILSSPTVTTCRINFNS